MKIHEYQAKSILAKYGVPVPQGHVIFNAADATGVAERLGGGTVNLARVPPGVTLLAS